jgi:hypothetical protein
MAFMIPQYTNETFHAGDTAHGEHVAIPASVWGTEANFAREARVLPESVATIRGKIWSRLSAPGYLDCTDWDGPFDTFALAKKSLAQTYDVDPETGEEVES